MNLVEEKNMATIKLYANGRYYDTDNKKYVTKEDIANLFDQKAKVKIIESKTQKDITRKTAKKLSDVKKGNKKTDHKPVSIKKWFDENKKWFSKNIDARIDKIVSAMNLPTRDQVAKLTSNMNQLNKKVAELEKRHAKKIKEMEKKHNRQIKDLEKSQEVELQEIKKEQEAVREEITAAEQVVES